MISDWHELSPPAGDPPPHLARTLLSGQTFRWRRRDDEPSCFVGVVNDAALELREATADAPVRFRVLNAERVDVAAARALLARHLSLDVARAPLDAAWAGDARAPRSFRRAHAAFGSTVRVVRVLDPLEALVSFVGSANNNIRRCEQMVAALCAAAGGARARLLHVDARDGVALRRFPSLDELATLDEAALWALGWGYRAPRLARLVAELRGEAGGVARTLLDGGALDDDDGDAAAARLAALPGVGPKVADCVLVFAYARYERVPIDTHAFQLACRDVLPAVRGRGLTAAVYARVAARFRELFGAERAAWAFMTLFVGELAMFRRELESPPTTSPHFAKAEPPTTPPAKRRRRESSPSRERTTDDGRAARRSARVARSSGIAPIKRELFSDA